MTLNYRCNLLKELLKYRREKNFIYNFLDIEENEENFPVLYSFYEDKLVFLSIKINEMRKHLYNISPQYRDMCDETDLQIDSVISILY
tara:strand:- start:108 stop:371 length:264 start_codon:yes stop_codon:yes gene_type:complete